MRKQARFFHYKREEPVGKSWAFERARLEARRAGAFSCFLPLPFADPVIREETISSWDSRRGFYVFV